MAAYTDVIHTESHRQICRHINSNEISLGGTEDMPFKGHLKRDPELTSVCHVTAAQICELRPGFTLR